MVNTAKNKAIGDARRSTYLRRANMLCKSFKLKIHRQSLSKEQLEHIQMMFLEAKWIYNYLLSHQDNLYDINAKYKELNVITRLDKDKNEIETTITHIRSSVKQELIQQICNQIKGLAVLKKHGHNVGALKFKSEFNSINFKQYNNTHYIKGNKIKLQGIKKPIRVCGLKQLAKYENIEYANARLVYDGYDYFIILTTYVDKQPENNKQNKIIGLDFGVQTSITCSNGDKINIQIGESERLKKLQAKLARQVKYSNNWYKTKSLIRKEYNHITNKKNDIANKIVHTLKTENELIIMQDEQLMAWRDIEENCAKLQHSILGRVKSKLVSSPGVIVLDKWFPTSKFCPVCGTKHENLTLSDRTFVCPNCKAKEDRDIHAANNMIYFYLQYTKDTAGTVDTSKPCMIKFSNQNLGVQENTTSLALC